VFSQPLLSSRLASGSVESGDPRSLVCRGWISLLFFFFFLPPPSPPLPPFHLLLPAVTSAYCVLLVADRYASLSKAGEREREREREGEGGRERESLLSLEMRICKGDHSRKHDVETSGGSFFRIARRSYPSLLFARARGECVKSHVPPARSPVDLHANDSRGLRRENRPRAAFAFVFLKIGRSSRIARLRVRAITSHYVESIDRAYRRLFVKNATSNRRRTFSVASRGSWHSPLSAARRRARAANCDDVERVFREYLASLRLESYLPTNKINELSRSAARMRARRRCAVQCQSRKRSLRSTLRASEFASRSNFFPREAKVRRISCFTKNAVRKGDTGSPERLAVCFSTLR